jgi:hypothetical protein
MAFGQTPQEAVPANVKAIQLVTSAAGWAIADERLLWSSNAGQAWNDITPAGPSDQSIDGAFFLDNSTGWALLSSAGSAANPVSIQLAATTNSGATWNSYALPAVIREVGDSYTGIVSLHFVDATHGWLMVRLASSSNFSLGRLFATSDGGATWTQLPPPPIGNSIRFVTAQEGWLAGGPGGDELYVTRDGGNTWQAAAVQPPSGARAGFTPQYALPVFTTGTDGTLAVNFLGTQASAFGIYNTHDGGQSWALTESQTTAAGQRIHAAVTNAGVVTASVASGKATVALGRAKRSASLRTPNAAIQQVQFKNEWQGWMLLSSSACASFKKDCTDTTELVATTDGGATLTDITPKSLQPTPRMQAMAVPGVIYQSPAPQTEGFDACTKATAAQLQDWWTNSPYTSVNVYLGGESVASCARPYPDASWIQTATGMGWKIIPTWVGLQAPMTGTPTADRCSTCTTCSHTISTDAGTAATQGTAEADSAIAATAAVGLDKTIIYFDMEKYNPTANVPTCQAAVQAFLNAWTDELHANGWQSGIYSSDADFQSDLTVDNPAVGPANVADAIWIARWNNIDAIYAGANYPKYWALQDQYWNNNQRIHQWNTGTKTYGHTTLSIDYNAVDSILALPGTLTLTTNVSGGGAITSDPAGVNCGSSCQTAMPINTNITLTATPIAGTAFIGWAGCDSSTGHTCTVMMNVARNVTATFSPVSTTSSGLIYNRLTQAYNGTMTVTNTGASAIVGPIEVVLSSLPAGITLVNATGNYGTSPYVTLSGASLAPGQSAQAAVQFRDSSNAKISYTPLVYSGSL